MTRAGRETGKGGGGGRGHCREGRPDSRKAQGASQAPEVPKGTGCRAGIEEAARLRVLSKHQGSPEPLP